MENRYPFIIDLKNRTSSSIRYKQGDTDSSILEINLVDGGLVKDITGETIVFNFAKPDGTTVNQDMSLTGGVTVLDALKGKFQCKLKNQTLAAPGVVICEIVFSNAGIISSTSKFNFTVESSIGGGPLSKNYITQIETTIAGWQNEIDIIKAAYDSASKANLSIEVTNARNGFANLDARLDNSDSQLANITTQKADKAYTDSQDLLNANKIAINQSRIDNLVATASNSFYQKCLSTDTGALLVVASGATTGQINLASVTPLAIGYTAINGDYVRLVYGVSSGTVELTDMRIDNSGNLHVTANDRISGIEQDLNTGYHITKPKWAIGYIGGADGVYVALTSNSNIATPNILSVKKGTQIKNNHTGSLIIYKFDITTGAFISSLISVSGGASYTFLADTNIKINLSYGVSTTDFTLGNSLVVITEVSKYAKLNQVDTNLNTLNVLNKNVLDIQGAISEVPNYIVNAIWEFGYVDGGDGSLKTNSFTARLLNILFMPIGSTLEVTNSNVTIAVSKYINGLWNSTNIFITLASGKYTFLSDMYIKINYGYAGNPAITDLTLPNSYVIIKKGTIKAYIDKVTSNLTVDSYWKGKKILWVGTSIPTSGYPEIVGTELGATVYNEAVGSSGVRAGHYNFVTGTDTMGYSGLYYESLMRSLSLSSTEKQAIFDNWSTWQPLIPTAPLTISDTDKAFYKTCSWDIKLAKYLTGGSIGKVDLYVFDHGHNDAGLGYNYDTLNTMPPTDTKDRRYFIGAMNFLIDKILTDNPRARICFIGHYENDRKTGISVAQSVLAEYWDYPLIKSWEKLGWTQKTITTTGYWQDSATWIPSGGTSHQMTMTQVWLADDLHPFNVGAKQMLADLYTNFINNVR